LREEWTLSSGSRGNGGLDSSPPPPAASQRDAPSPARTPGSLTAGVILGGSGIVLAAALLGLWLLVALTLAVTLAASIRLRP
jgi:hypothetical protein